METFDRFRSHKHERTFRPSVGFTPMCQLGKIGTYGLRFVQGNHTPTEASRQVPTLEHSQNWAQRERSLWWRRTPQWRARSETRMAWV